MPHKICCFASTVVLICACLPLGAQKYQPKSIQFKGAPEYSAAELLAASGLRRGVQVDAEEIRVCSKRLADSGVFDNISYKFDGSDLVYSLVPSTSLFSVRLDNLPLTPGKDLDAKLHQRLPLYHGKVPAEGGLLDGVRGVLAEMLAAQGIKTEVVAVPWARPGTKDPTAISFAITSTQVQVGEIQLQGVSAAMQAKIQKVVALATNLPYDSENSAANMVHAFEAFYAEEGYAAAKVQATPSATAKINADAIRIPFTLNIQEGHVYKLGAIHLPPDALISEAEIDKALGGHVGGVAKGLSLRNTWFLVTSKYKSKGYLDVVVTPHPTFDEANDTVSYTVEVNPGPVYRLAYVKFENASDDLRRELMRNWQMLPGDPFDETYVANFLVNAQKEDPALQRSLATLKASYDVLSDPQTHDVNCVIKLEKRL